jgi:hypothetical protein
VKLLADESVDRQIVDRLRQTVTRCGMLLKWSQASRMMLC